MAEQTRYILPEEAIPTSWYNLAADLPHPLPPVLHPGTHQPIGPPDLAPLGHDREEREHVLRGDAIFDGDDHRPGAPLHGHRRGGRITRIVHCPR